jgi:hypothetical protein
MFHLPHALTKYRERPEVAKQKLVVQEAKIKDRTERNCGRE